MMYHQLTQEERYMITAQLRCGCNKAQIARLLGRDPSNGRHVAAWLGLTPRQHSTAGKQRLGVMTKHGDVYLRTLLIHGARAVLRTTAARKDRKSRWVEKLRQRRLTMWPPSLAAKHARIIWALLAKHQDYQPLA
jgi:transposase